MDGTRFHGVVLIVAALVVGWVLDWEYRFWNRSADSARRVRAEAVLRSHGMEVHTYLPSFGAEAGELRDALTAFDYVGKVVLDREGCLVGRLLPKESDLITCPQRRIGHRQSR